MFPIFPLSLATVGVWSMVGYLLNKDRISRRNAVHPHADRNLNDHIRRALIMSGVCSNPGAVVVRSDDGYVTLSGDVFWSEANNVLALVRAMHGVKGVRNSLDVHQSAEGVSGLQGRPYPAAAPSTESI
jgi:osmotically-inducible protein OsmY